MKKALLFLVVIIFSILVLELSSSIILNQSTFCEEYASGYMRDLTESYQKTEIPGLYFIPKPSNRFNENLRVDQIYPNQTDKLRIFVIGDSITGDPGYLGGNVSDLYSEILEANLTNVEVWNLGVSKYNTFQELTYYREFFSQYNPDIIIIGYGEMQDYHPARLYMNPNLSVQDNCINSIYGKQVNNKLHMYKAYLLLNYKIKNIIDSEKYPSVFFKGEQEEIKKNRQALIDFQDEAPIVINVVLPTLSNYQRDAWLLNYNFTHKIDLYKVLTEEHKVSESDVYHLNKEGHRIIANNIQRYLLNSEIIDSTMLTQSS